MRVLIQATPDASGSLPNPYSFELSSGGRESPSNLVINGQRNSQPFNGLRAASTKFVDRKNARSTVSFDVTRLHKTIDKAQEYMFTHQSNITPSGTVIFYSENGTKFYLRDSVIETTRAHHTGKTTFHSYSINGGLITTT